MWDSGCAHPPLVAGVSGPASSGVVHYAHFQPMGGQASVHPYLYHLYGLDG